MGKLLKRVGLVAGILLGVALVVGVGFALWLNSRLQVSLPLLDGELALAGLAEKVEIERDDHGVPTIRASNRSDLARATGFLHAQDRFFQMDLLRRRAAGELSELIGAVALPVDRRTRIHRFRWRAARNLAGMDAGARGIVDAYTEGVNAGLEALGAVPPEYLALRLEPRTWESEDSFLVLYAMFLDLQGGTGRHELAIGRLHERLPGELFDFLVPEGTEWDAPLVGEVITTPPVPGPEVFDLRLVQRGPVAASARGSLAAAALAASNNWAVAGSHTQDGGALLANDMHLGLGLPNIWYRVSFVWSDPESPGQMLRATGVSLPGTPALIAGSNGHVAWGFTNTYGDWIDMVPLEHPPGDVSRYLTPSGYRELERVTEVISVQGGDPEALEVVSTIWGPVTDTHADRPERYALRWVAHDAEAANFELFDLETARDLGAAIEVARRCGIPAQNIVIADSAGRIGWTLAGRIPRRFGHDGLVPVSWADGSRGWDGWLDPEEVPRIVDPPTGRLWTANNRTAGDDMLRAVGRRCYPLGARARQIRDALLALERARPTDMLAIQLDDRALFLSRWRELLLSTLTDEAVNDAPGREELRRQVEETWTGRASTDSVAYRMVRAFRGFSAELVFGAIVAATLLDADVSEYTGRVFQWEGPLWGLLTERPLHLLDPRFESWDELLLEAADKTMGYYDENYEPELGRRTWGERNTVRVSHPLGRAVPQLARWLNIEPLPMPGDSQMPRVQSPGFGASERFAVSPGREEDGYFHMPGGQSGHFLSPYYRKGHEAWVNGEPTPFLPGPAAHHLKLIPG